MVFWPTRGDGALRHGPGVQHVPDVGGSVLDRNVYTDPARFELERERVLRRSWLIACRSDDVAERGDRSRRVSPPPPAPS